MKNQIVSTRQLKIFQVVCLVPWLAILGFLCFFLASNFQTNSFVQLGIYAYLFYVIYYKRVFRLRTIGFDETNLFIQQNGQEVMIPMTDVKYIQLRTVFGVHSVKLYQDQGYGDELFFKSSLWYPFNFQKIDKQVYLLKMRIEAAKSNYSHESSNRLGS